MNEARKILPIEMHALAGDVRALLNQIGHSSDAGFVSELPSFREVADLASLKDFLQRYSLDYLFPLELPAVCKAYLHASRYECRELVALDQQLGRVPALQRFAAASTQVGRTHLLDMRPLRENRFVQRYLAALEAGEAQAWHTLVYGISLHVYSVPLRQGLLSYTHLVIDGFAQAAAGRLALEEPAVHASSAEIVAPAPSVIDALIGTGSNLFTAT